MNALQKQLLIVEEQATVRLTASEVAWLDGMIQHDAS